MRMGGRMSASAEEPVEGALPFIEGLTVIMCANSYAGPCRRGIDGFKMAFVNLQSAIPKLGLDDVGDWWRHAVAYHIPSALQVAAKALLSSIGRRSHSSLVVSRRLSRPLSNPHLHELQCEERGKVRDAGGGRI